MSNLRNLSIGFIFASYLSGCGSRLPRDINIKRPVASGSEDSTRIDLNMVEFTDIETGAAVNAGTWMDDLKTDFILLTFGSRACSACNKKARAIRDNYLSSDQFSLVGMESRLAIVGVNTDADSISLTQRFVKSEGFSFIRWSDPRGTKMLKWFMPEGRSYGVPLTVMINRHGVILWAYTNDSSATVPEMMERARTTIDSNALPAPTPDPGVPDSEEPILVKLPPVLAYEGTHRMREVMVSTCGINRGSTKPLEALLPLTYVATFFHIERDVCGANCSKNRLLLQRKVDSFLTADIGAGFLYAGQVPVDCETQNTEPNKKSKIQSASGGRDFFEVFASHFDWNHAVTDQGDGRLAIAPLAPELTLAFDRGGKLLFSAEGLLDEARVDSFLRSIWIPGTGKSKPDFARGPAWNFHGLMAGQTTGGAVDFSEWRNLSQFTIVNAFGESCSSCMAELKHWSRSGGLFDVCEKSPGFCTVGVVENGLPESAFSKPGSIDSRALDTYLNGIFGTLVGRGISAPFIMLDPYSPENDGGQGYLKRFFDGYLSARNPEFGFDFRTIVSDREGKILGVFKAVPPEDSHGKKIDHVEDFVLRLRNAQQGVQ